MTQKLSGYRVLEYGSYKELTLTFYFIVISSVWLVALGPSVMGNAYMCHLHT